MAIDFESEFGINGAYVQNLYEGWREGSERVDAAWREMFERARSRGRRAGGRA